MSQRFRIILSIVFFAMVPHPSHTADAPLSSKNGRLLGKADCLASLDTFDEVDIKPAHTIVAEIARPDINPPLIPSVDAGRIPADAPTQEMTPFEGFASDDVVETPMSAPSNEVPIVSQPLTIPSINESPENIITREPTVETVTGVVTAVKESEQLPAVTPVLIPSTNQKPIIVKQPLAGQSAGEPEAVPQQDLLEQESVGIEQAPVQENGANGAAEVPQEFTSTSQFIPESLPENQSEAPSESESPEADPENQSAQQGPGESSSSSEGLPTSSPSTMQESIPAAPVPAAPQFSPPVEQVDQIPIDEIVGIDTVDLEEPQGNWLYKRIWWERAEQKYEKLKQRVAEILETRMLFFTQRSEIDKDVIDPFYQSIGLKRGELSGVIADVLAKLNERKEKGETLDIKERDMFEKAQTELAALEQLHKDVEGITQLDHDLDSSLAKLMEQINVVRQYEQEAWLKFKEIARVLDEKAARELFFQIEVSTKNVRDVQEYLAGPFTQHYKQLIETIHKQVEQVNREIQALIDKGVDLKSYLEKIRAPEQPVQLVVEDDEEVEIIEQPKGIVGTILDYIVSAFGAVWGGVKKVGSFIFSIVRWPYDKIVGTTPVASVNDADDDEDTQDQIED